MARTIRIRTDCTLKHQANLGEDVSEYEFESGTSLPVLKTWANAWLVKDADGRLFNVKKDLAQES